MVAVPAETYLSERDENGRYVSGSSTFASRSRLAKRIGRGFRRGQRVKYHQSGRYGTVYAHRPPYLYVCSDSEPTRVDCLPDDLDSLRVVS